MAALGRSDEQLELAPAPPAPPKVRWPLPVACAGGAVLAFQLAHRNPAFGFLILVYLFCLVILARQGTRRQAFYLTFGAGMVISALQLDCFYTIFGAAAVALWAILALWLALFALLARLAFSRLRPAGAACLVPFLWTGLEFFRSELYYLRFSWLSPGYALAHNLAWFPLGQLGAYGTGFILTAAAGLLTLVPPRKQLFAGAGCLLALALISNAPPRANSPAASDASALQVAGVQLEFAPEQDVLAELTKLAERHPAAQLLVLSEYTFDGQVPPSFKEWCRQHARHLIVGAKDELPTGEFFNTAFVIGPQGEVVFRQAKSVPIQFFKDGLPAREQKVWDSPWGKLGICICYDLSYTRVTDRLVRQGAQALIVPTMDVAEWGERQHLLHARVAPVRAAEYGLPIFRLASSGISQVVDRRGAVLAAAPFPGQFAAIAGSLEMGRPGHLPLDRWLAPGAVAITVGFVIWLGAVSLGERFFRRT